MNSAGNTASFGYRGKELLNDLKRSDFLPSWDEDGVQSVINELSQEFRTINQVTNARHIANSGQRGLLDASNGTKACWSINNTAISRNFRVLNR
jgi:uncharacterized protein (UPF0371 family)